MSVAGMRASMTNERGVALPMALITLVLLTTLMLAFAVLSQTEPVIAANQLRVSQARALAESGFEYAVWALTNATDPHGIESPLASSPAPSPFDGTTFTTLGITGGFTVRVTNGPDPDSRTITAVGWTPTNSPTDIRTKAHRQVTANVAMIPNLGINAPCALCVKGALNITGNSSINGANSDASCGGNNKYGTYTRDATTTRGSASISGGTDPDTGAPRTIAQNQDPSSFNRFTFSNTTLDALKAVARKNNTYFGPGFSGATNNSGEAVAGTYSGSVTFNASNKVKNGVVFVDTTDGVNLDPRGSNTSTLGSLTVHGNPFTAGDFQGYLVINGSLSISGNMQIMGLVYALNDLSYHGTGGGGIAGLAISQNIRDASATSIDTSTSGNSNITFSCQYASAANFVSHGFHLVPGSYREQSE
jgi:hypothetical protein